MSRKRGGEKYVKSFDGFTHLLTMLFVVIMRFGSLHFKQIKQNFPPRYFYGESANAIKIQIWVTLIANLPLSVLQSSLTRPWSFSGLATMVRIVMMYYINLESFFNRPDADLRIMLAEASESPPTEAENP